MAAFGRCSLRRVWSMPVDLQSQPTLAAEEVGAVFREPHIKTGYRPPYQTWTYYMASLFHIHNETLNVWSHLGALFLFIHKVYLLGWELDYLADPLAWAMLGFAFGTMAYAALSTTAHLLQSKSELAHYTCFQIDYVGIGLNGIGNGILLYYMTGTEHFYQLCGTFYMPLNLLMGFLVCVCMSIAKLCYHKPYPLGRKLWQMGSAGLHVLYGGLPFFYKMAECIDIGDCIVEEIKPHLKYAFWFVVSALFFASNVPERFLPGAFDTFGHGHQIFHVAIVYTSLLQYEVGLQEIRSRSRDLVAVANPHYITIFGGILLVLIADIIFIALTHGWRKQKCREDHIYSQIMERKKS